MPRTVHYHASHSGGGMHFECYAVALRAHHDAWNMIDRHLRAKYPTDYKARHQAWRANQRSSGWVPAPKRATDLRKVTCWRCLVELERLIAVKLGKRPVGALLAAIEAQP